MHPSDFRHRIRECPNCGRRVRLNFEGRYRRHFATGADGRLRLCAASGQPAPEPLPQHGAAREL